MLERIKNILKEDGFIALQELDKFTKNTKYNNIIILYFNKYNRLKNAKRKKLISFNKFEKKMDELILLILDEIDEISNDIENNFASNFKIEKLISGDESNFLDIAFLEKALKAQKSVCKIKVGNKSGTGFLVSRNGIVLTNNHVINNEKLLENTKLIFNYQKNILGQNKQTFEYDLDITYFKTNEKLDYTLVKIKNFQDILKWGVLRLTKNINIDDKVYIIQHPKGGDKKITMANNRVTEIKEPYIRYSVDTLEGSSGSPILNENFEVIGLHHAGLNEKEANQGILISSIFRKK